jgi:phytoene dehydrogenase-like protein
MKLIPMDDGDELFTVPLPLPPPGRLERDVVFFRHGAPAVPGPEREDEDIMLRRVPRAVAQRFRASAGGRGMTHAQYLAALVELHESARTRADAGDAELIAELERLGLTTVTV